jgi:hypothetical protein
MKVIVLCLFTIAIIYAPFAIVWSLNTLFMLAIPYTIETWLAVFILSGVISTRVISTRVVKK